MGDDAIVSLKKFSSLTRMSLDNTKITDKGLASVSALTELVTLNLKGTRATIDGVKKLIALPKLRKFMPLPNKRC